MKKAFEWYGQSLVLNSILVVLNFVGVTFTTIGFHKNFENQQGIFVSIGIVLIILSSIGLFFLKGKEFMAYVSRILVGGLFIVSGLIKANDPLGFSYKLEEYFEDGALAFRIKEWFGAPGFSLEFLIDYALFFSVLICIVEIVLGVLVIIGGKIRFTSWMLMLTMIFFTFLTWHTANCDSNKKFTDRDTYSANDPVALEKVQAAKTNREINVVSTNSETVVIDELKQPQCVTDCGCFGDAMKGSVGRSLTPSESLWKDYILLYFVIWIFISQKLILPNTTKQNLYVIPISLIVVTFFSFVFGWYFPILFAIISLVIALWVNRSGGLYFGNYWGAMLSIVIICLIFTGYVLRYEPVKDYRPYAEGSNLIEKMNDGVEGKYLNMLVYKNLKTGEKVEYEGSSQEYIDSKIWEKTNLWKYDTMVSKEVIPTRLPSISTQFNPIVSVSEIGKNELKLDFIKKMIQPKQVKGYELFDIENNEKIKVTEEEYNDSYSDTSFYTIKREILVDEAPVTEVSIRDYITKAPIIFILFSKDLAKCELADLTKIKRLEKILSVKNIPFVLISNEQHTNAVKWLKNKGLNLASFTNDGTELKAIARSNPSLMVVKRGVVKGKYPNKAIPSIEWIKKHILN
jgi:uncharacterized membrane protein YphA (DoxX/SURF4 family)